MNIFLSKGDFGDKESEASTVLGCPNGTDRTTGGTDCDGGIRRSVGGGVCIE